MSFLDTSLSGGKKLQIGLDIGSSFIKGVALERNRKELVLARIASRQLPKNAISEKDISDRESVIYTIQNIMEELDPKAQEIVISICGNRIFSDKVVIKKQNKPAQIREQVMTQAEERIPMGTAGVTISYFPITDNEVGKNIDVEIVAARSDFIRGYVEMVHDAGFRVTAVDVDSLAIFNSFEHNFELSADSVICLMNIGYSVTNLVFVIKGFFYSMRDISIGMSTMWETVQSELSLSSDDMNKLQLGFYEHIEPSKLKQALYSATGDIKVSLDTAFTYLETVTQGLTVNKIYLSGGGALVPNMSDLIEERMNIGTDFLNPFKNIVFNQSVFNEQNPEKIAPLYSVAAGLALRADPE